MVLAGTKGEDVEPALEGGGGIASCFITSSGSIADMLAITPPLLNESIRAPFQATSLPTFSWLKILTHLCLYILNEQGKMGGREGGGGDGILTLAV